MIEEAVKEFGLDCSQSYVVGDRGVDVELARQLGAKAILVLTGYGRGEWEYRKNEWKGTPDFVAEDLFEAVRWILGREE